MGLLDILNGMQNGPRGSHKSSGGMSPMTMAILALLAYKGYKQLSGGSSTATASPTPQVPPQRQDTAVNQADGGLLGSGGLGGILNSVLGGGGNASGGGLSDVLKGGLGGLLAGGAAGTILSGGLGDLLKQFQQNGQGDAVNSWVGAGPNKQIAPQDLASALGANEIEQLTSRTGLSREQLLSELSTELPGAIDQFTPNGRIPTDDELSRMA